MSAVDSQMGVEEPRLAVVVKGPRLHLDVAVRPGRSHGGALESHVDLALEQEREWKNGNPKSRDDEDVEPQRDSPPVDELVDGEHALLAHLHEVGLAVAAHLDRRVDALN